MPSQRLPVNVCTAQNNQTVSMTQERRAYDCRSYHHVSGDSCGEAVRGKVLGTVIDPTRVSKKNINNKEYSALHFEYQSPTPGPSTK